MIKILENKPKDCTPHYELVLYYMIGDSDGDIEKKVDISIENPYIEKFIKLLDSLHETKNNWGIILNSEYLNEALEEKQITRDDYNFLNAIMFDEMYSNSKQDLIYFNEFYGCITSGTEREFYVYQDCNLFYINDHGEQFETEIV
jgi:hypothetical protein